MSVPIAAANAAQVTAPGQVVVRAPVVTITVSLPPQPGPVTMTPSTVALGA